jgi:hypothetical protein
MANDKNCRTGKRIYRNERHAKEVLAWAKKNRTQGKSIPTRCYQCEFCNYWHLTSKAHKEEEHFFNLKYYKQWIRLLKNNQS